MTTREASRVCNDTELGMNNRDGSAGYAGYNGTHDSYQDLVDEFPELADMEVNATLLQMHVDELGSNDGLVTDGMTVRRDGKLVAKTSVVFCRLCKTRAKGLGGVGGKKGSYRYAYHCTNCHESWSQIRPEDICNGDPAYGETKKRPAQCSCLTSSSNDIAYLQARVKEVIAHANAVISVANIVAPLPVADATEGEHIPGAPLAVATVSAW